MSDEQHVATLASGARVTSTSSVAGGALLIRRGVGVRVRDILDRLSAGEERLDAAEDFGLSVGEVDEVALRWGVFEGTKA